MHEGRKWSGRVWGRGMKLLERPDFIGEPWGRLGEDLRRAIIQAVSGTSLTYRDYVVNVAIVSIWRTMMISITPSPVARGRGRHT